MSSSSADPMLKTTSLRRVAGRSVGRPLLSPRYADTTSSGSTFSSSSTQPAVTVIMPSSAEGLEGGGRSLSQPTQHALIALGSIGATILVILIGWMIYHKKMSICSNEACILHRHDRYRSIKEVTPPLGRWSVAGSEWRKNERTKSAVLNEAQQTLEAEGVLPAPVPAVTKDGSQIRTSASRHLRTPVLSSPTSTRRASGQEDMLVDTDVAGRLSPTPSSSILPELVKPHSSHWSRSQTSSRSSLPFYLKGVANLPQPPPENSRFSWTDSQAPRTPTTSQPRYSISTSRSSVPRFRTIDSWVGNQAARVQNDQSDEEVPAVPAKYRSTNSSDSTLFQQHPGTEIHLPRVSIVPSEILDQATPKRRTGASF